MLNTFLLIIILVGYCSGKHTVNYCKIDRMKHLLLVMIMSLPLIRADEKKPSPPAKAKLTPVLFDARGIDCGLRFDFWFIKSYQGISLGARFRLGH